MALEMSPILSGISDIGNTALSIGNWFFNRDLLRKQWEREDTAVQRRVADLSAAGLSKTLAAGSAATSTYSASSAPNINNQTASALLDIERLNKDIKQADANIAYTDAQTDLINKQIDFMENTGIDPNEKNPIMALLKFVFGYGQKSSDSNSSSDNFSDHDKYTSGNGFYKFQDIFPPNKTYPFIDKAFKDPRFVKALSNWNGQGGY